MSAGRLKKTKGKNKFAGKGTKRAFLLIFGIMAIAGFFLSKGSVTQFFKVLAVEAAVFALIMFCIFIIYKYKKGSRVVDGSRKHNNSYGMNSVSKCNNVDEYSNGEMQGRSIKEIKTRKKNYNWIIDDENTQSSQRQRDTIETDRKLVYAGKVISGEKKTMGEDDIKARVASWSEAVDYSGTVFRRIIEKTKESLKDEEAGNTENYAEDPQEDEKDVEKFLQGEKVCEDVDRKEEVKEIIDIDKVQSEIKEIDKLKEIQETEILEEVNGEEVNGEEVNGEEVNGEEINEETGGIWFAKDVKTMEEIEKNKVPKIEVVDGEVGVFGNVSETEETNETNGANERQCPLPNYEEEVALPTDLLKEIDNINGNLNTSVEAERKAQKLIDTLESFGVGARIINISEGPAVTRYELQPDYGVKVSKIVNLADDIALNLAAVGVRIEAPIPGKAAVGIEIPNREVTAVWLREVIESGRFQNHPSKLAFAVGKDIAGNPVVADIATMPHLLIAGATGSGKSVCINTLITSLLYKASPKDVRLLMVDPKVVELSIYNGIPHLLIPVVTDPKKAAGALNWAVQEMTNRYKLFAENNVRDLKGYNAIMSKAGHETLPQIVIIIDELADLMMVAPNDVEDCICRLAQMARAAGMHLVIATQRPSVNVITGVIKANIPSRVSFAVSSQVDSRTILDMSGAEKLLGKGDMLFYPLGMQKPVRIQGALITDKEVENIVDFIKSQCEAEYDEEIIDTIDSHSDSPQLLSEDDDELLPQVIDMVVEQEQASTSLIQRKFKIGYARAARIIDQMEAGGIVGPFEGSKPRKVLITKQQWQEMKS